MTRLTSKILLATLIQTCLTTQLWGHGADQTLVELAALFDSRAVVGGPALALVPCTLSGGTETTCFKVTVLPEPSDHEMGPWCPRNTSDTAKAAGVWLDQGTVYDVDGPTTARSAMPRGVPLGFPGIPLDHVKVEWSRDDRGHLR